MLKKSLVTSPTHEIEMNSLFGANLNDEEGMPPPIYFAESNLPIFDPNSLSLTNKTFRCRLFFAIVLVLNLILWLGFMLGKIIMLPNLLKIVSSYFHRCRNSI